MGDKRGHLGDKRAKKNNPIFLCEYCDYKCSKLYHWNRHVLTARHSQLAQSVTKVTEKGPKNMLSCEFCNKIYKSRNGLWKHKKICPKMSPEKGQKGPENIEMITGLIMDVVKQNNQLTNKILDMCKTNNQYISNINSNNTHNHTFNLNVFLNETCKDAMNISDFVNSLQIDLGDLENVGKLGYVEGISNIIVRNLKALDITERPIHCADKKREVIYIKDENKWEKEDDKKKKLKHVIKRIANRNEKLLPKFKEKYPDYKDAESQRSDQYSKIVIETMGGNGENIIDKEDKIVKKIVKEVVIDKSTLAC